jgi:hypothetical protein
MTVRCVCAVMGLCTRALRCDVIVKVAVVIADHHTDEWGAGIEALQARERTSSVRNIESSKARTMKKQAGLPPHAPVAAQDAVRDCVRSCVAAVFTTLTTHAGVSHDQGRRRPRAHNDATRRARQAVAVGMRVFVLCARACMCAHTCTGNA